MRDYENILKSIEDSDSLVASLKITNELLLDIREALLSKEKPAPALYYPSQPKKYEPEAGDISVFNLPISQGLKTALRNGSIQYLSQMRHISAYELLKFRLMGKVTLKELITVLKDYGIDIPEFP